MPRDLYKILRIPHTASVKEIKTSYRKLALRYHPDTHDGDKDKTEEFRKVTEAYSVLSDEKKKSKYDLKMGFRFNKNRRMPPPPNYRTVEFPDPPKHWKMVWDHKLHHDMHYGDGLYEEIVRRAMKKMEKEGAFDYHSPIGKGFSFSKDPKMNKNPYNQYQGKGLNHDRGKVEFIFEEYGFGAKMNESGRATKEHLQRRVRIVEDLHGRREQRREYQSERKKQQEKQAKENSAFQKQDESCIIL
mmetsp:Transcript_8462/g.19194  ORF Transcript_8462/g.19194 Transcript_8462/m.19194 type:complete len:244 (-) Transcript_8462:494-1225(-)